MEQTDFIREPKQDRSKNTTEKILKATGEFLKGKPLESLSVAEIVHKAGISVGGFYARFSSKESLLHAFHEHILDQGLKTVVETMKAENLKGNSARDVIETYIRMTFRFFEKNRKIMQQIVIRLKKETDSEFRKRGTEYNGMAHGLLKDRLLERKHEIGRADREEAIHFGVKMVSASLRESVLFDQQYKLNTAKGKKFLRELVRAFCSYLDISKNNSTKKRSHS